MPAPARPLPEPTSSGEPLRLEPYPDVLLGELADSAPGPEARYEARESPAKPPAPCCPRLSNQQVTPGRRYDGEPRQARTRRDQPLRRVGTPQARRRRTPALTGPDKS